MLRIPCPCCGLRDETEFAYGGPADRSPPAPTVDDAAWADYLYARDNPRGAYRERWAHVFGCGVWLIVTRDTVSHQIASAVSFAEASIEERACV